MKKKAKRKETKTKWKKKCLKAWSLKVRNNDGFYCQWCLKKSKWVQAHHIVACSISNAYGWLDLLNGMTLCMHCHWRIKTEPDEYIPIRDSYLAEKGLTYEGLRSLYQATVKTSIDSYKYLLKELEK